MGVGKGDLVSGTFQTSTQWWQIQDNAKLFGTICCVLHLCLSGTASVFGRRRFAAGAAAAAGAGGGAGLPGLIQQAWTRPLRLSAAFGSMPLPCRIRQRNEAWTWRARAAETVVEIEMAERRVEVVSPEQPDHPAAEPDALGIAGRPGDFLLRLGEFVDLSEAPWPAPGRPAFRRFRFFRKSRRRKAKHGGGDQQRGEWAAGER